MFHWKKNNPQQYVGASRWLAPALALLTLFAIGLLIAATPALAQELPTATPDADGVIYAQVQVGDTLWNIAARHRISLQELLDFNDLTESDLIQPGDLLIVGYGDPPATETPLPTVTPTFPPPPPPATAVPPPATGVCLLAFDDQNQDGIRNNGEPLKAGVAITLFTSEAVVANYVTDGVSEPFCLDDLPPGEYNVTRSLNRTLGEVLTTEGNQGIILSRGRLVNLAFGSTTPDTAVPNIATETPIIVDTPLPPTAAVGATAVAATPTSPPSPTPSTETSALWPWLVVALLVLLLSATAVYWLRRQS